MDYFWHKQKRELTSQLSTIDRELEYSARQIRLHKSRISEISTFLNVNLQEKEIKRTERANARASRERARLHKMSGEQQLTEANNQLLEQSIADANKQLDRQQKQLMSQVYRTSYSVYIPI